MTCRELYLRIRRELADAGIEDPGAEAVLLFSHFTGMDRAALAVRGEEALPPREEEALLRAAARRREREPLQYILGRWPFMGLQLAVGPGVLCPREDTAVLVEALASRLKGIPAPAGLDLCAGTGAVALGLCTLLPEAEICCVELSEEAFPYLEENLAACPQYHVRAVRGDVLRPETAEHLKRNDLHFIAANPPYVSSGTIETLQAEVRREPALALDGGPDGLRFYRALCGHWTALLAHGGLLAVEIGEEQGRAVEALFAAAGLEEIEILPDLAGLDRCVIGRKK